MKALAGNTPDVIIKLLSGMKRKMAGTCSGTIKSCYGSDSVEKTYLVKTSLT